MNNLELLKEQYAEQMFEQRANGIPTISFEEWDMRRKARLEFFRNWNNATADSESIAEAMCS